MTRFQTDFTSSEWNFCRLIAGVPPRETSPVAKSEEKSMFLQAKPPGVTNLIETFSIRFFMGNCKLQFAVTRLQVHNVKF